MRVIGQSEKFRRLFAKNIKQYNSGGEWLFSWRELMRVKQLLRLNKINGVPEESVVFNFTYGNITVNAATDYTKIESIMGYVLLNTENFDELKKFCEAQYS